MYDPMIEMWACPPFRCSHCDELRSAYSYHDCPDTDGDPDGPTITWWLALVPDWLDYPKWLDHDDVDVDNNGK